MNWFFGENTKITDFNEKFWSDASKVVESKFLPFVVRESFFLTSNESRNLHDLTYQSEQLPFGRVDQISTVGMVAIDEDYITKFQDEVGKSLQLIQLVPDFNFFIQNVVKCYVPLSAPSQKSNLRKKGSGKSCHWLKGAIFLSLPEKDSFSELELAINIVHEIGHQVLMIYQDCDNLLENINYPIYSSVRKTERPAIMSFHALVAVYFMYRLTAGLLVSFESNGMTEKVKYIRNKMAALYSDFTEGMYAIKEANFTPFGTMLIMEMLEDVLKLKGIS